jgi:hypothetical protein
MSACWMCSPRTIAQRESAGWPHHRYAAALVSPAAQRYLGSAPQLEDCRWGICNSLARPGRGPEHERIVAGRTGAENLPSGSFQNTIGLSAMHCPEGRQNHSPKTHPRAALGMGSAWRPPEKEERRLILGRSPETNRPQGLKPGFSANLSARLKSCPSQRLSNHPLRFEGYDSAAATWLP